MMLSKNDAIGTGVNRRRALSRAGRRGHDATALCRGHLHRGPGAVRRACGSLEGQHEAGGGAGGALRQRAISDQTAAARRRPCWCLAAASASDSLPFRAPARRLWAQRTAASQYWEQQEGSAPVAEKHCWPQGGRCECSTAIRAPLPVLIGNSLLASSAAEVTGAWFACVALVSRTDSTPRLPPRPLVHSLCAPSIIEDNRLHPDRRAFFCACALPSLRLLHSATLASSPQACTAPFIRRRLTSSPLPDLAPGRRRGVQLLPACRATPRPVRLLLSCLLLLHPLLPCRP